MNYQDWGAFKPQGDTVNIPASTTSARVLLPTSRASAGRALRVFNSSTAPAFLKWGDVTVEANLTECMPIAPGAVEVITIPSVSTHIAAILSSGTGAVYFTSGEGI